MNTVVRVCEPSYKKDELESRGIEVLDLAYDDGTFPPPNIVDEWFEILRTKWAHFKFAGNWVERLIKNFWKFPLTRRFNETSEACVAVHCVAGLGRAPVLVALALIELGLKYEGAVELIRE